MRVFSNFELIRGDKKTPSQDARSSSSYSFVTRWERFLREGCSLDISWHFCQFFSLKRSHHLASLRNAEHHTREPSDGGLGSCSVHQYTIQQKACFMSYMLVALHISIYMHHFRSQKSSLETNAMTPSVQIPFPK